MGPRSGSTWASCRLFRASGAASASAAKRRPSRARRGWSARIGRPSAREGALTEARFPVGDLAQLERLIAELRPKLHRYCARMTGSVVDGEDVLQETLIKAIEAFPHTGPLANAEGWLFRIAHNAAMDFLRRRSRQQGLQSDAEDLETIADPDSEIERRQAAATSLRTLMRLPVAQRSSVILMDVLGHSLEEVSQVLDTTVPAVKAALHRGRLRLRELAAEPDDRPPPALSDQDRLRLANYVTHFNGRDFDALRALLADEVRVEVVNRTRLNGRSEASR